MRNILAIALSFPLVACIVGDETDGPGGSGGGGGSGSGSGSGGGGQGISGRIMANETWSGEVSIVGITTIDAGVTVTVSAGATLTFKNVASLQIDGIFDVQGTSASKVTIKGENGSFGGMTVNGGGELRYAFVVQTNGPISTNSTGRATIVDTRMSRVSGDFLMMSGGTLDVSYSAVGVEPGEMDTTHCNMHFGGAGNVIKFSHSNVSSSAYGIMFYGGMGADFTYTNWFDNTVDVDVQQANPVSGDFSNSWFQDGAPTGAGITANNIQNVRLPACTGANDATCAGPRA